MKRIIPTLIVFLSFYGNISAQYIDTLPWCPPGATWVYKNFESFYKLSFIKDTIIDADTAKIIILEGASKPINSNVFSVGYSKLFTYYLKEKNDSIFYYWNKGNDLYEWIYVYDFKLEEDSFQYIDVSHFGYPCVELDSVSVSLDTLLIGLQNRVVINKNSYSGYFAYPTVLPKIGGLRSPFYSFAIFDFDDCFQETPNIDWNWINYIPLLCYEDSLRDPINFNALNYAYNCEEYITSILYEDFGSSINIYPNPFQELVFINHLPFGAEISLYNLQGEKINVELGVNNSLVIEKNISKGVYFLAIKNSTGSVIKKIIKN
jgi:hypothetical protein